MVRGTEDKQYVHDLIDQNSPQQLANVVQLLETLVGCNNPIPHELVLAELDLTTADWERLVGAAA